MATPITFNEKDFHFLKNITVEDLANEHYLNSMVDFINKLDSKISNGRILVMDQTKPENTKIYTYAKFVEIYDEHGLDGFLYQ